MNYRASFATATGTKIAGLTFKIVGQSEQVDDDGISLFVQAEDNRIFSTANLGRALQEGLLSMAEDNVTGTFKAGTSLWTNDQGVTMVRFNNANAKPTF